MYTRVALACMLGGLVGVGCATHSAESTPEPGIVLEYHSAQVGLMQSTLNLAPTRQRISAVTHLADEGCVTETVRFDTSGRVLDATISLVAALSSRSREVVLDAASGYVEVTTPTFHTYWKVPKDLPWAWTSLLSDPNSGAPVTTPLEAMVAQRAAAADAAVRWLDIGAFQSHSVMADQLLVSEEGAATVVLGDDWADLTDGVPARMHLAGPDADLEGNDPELLSATLAACDCSQRDRVRTRGC